MRIGITLACVLAWRFAVAPAALADWDDGMVARQRGDFAAAWKNLLPEAEAGAADAQEAVGQMLIRGQGVPKQETAGVAWLRRAAEGGSVAGMTAFGTAALQGTGMTRDPVLGVQWLTLAAKSGDIAAMLVLGVSYEQGASVPRNVVAAHDWFLKAAEAGNADAMSRLAELLLSPTEGATDESAGMRWLKKAADSGQTAAQARLAQILAIGGHGTQKSESGAAEWALKAAFANHDAAALLCRLYQKGLDDHPPEPVLAFRWCTAAAESGVPESMVILAGLYLDGAGTAKNPGSAFIWATIAAAQGEGTVKQAALRVRAAAGELLGPGEQELADAKARAWRKLP